MNWKDGYKNNVVVKQLGTKVFLASPCYGSIPHPDFVICINNTLNELGSLGIEAQWKPFTGCCYLPPARNKLVQEFLKTDYTDFVFIDIDLAWKPEALLKLLSHKVDIVCGAYSTKDDNETYPVFAKTEPPTVNSETGLVELHYGPTGFMRIRRDVFDRYLQFFPNIYVDEWRNGVIEGTYINFFDTLYHDRRWYGEDVNFCYKCAEAGIQVWCDPNLDLWHYGLKAWPGNYSKWLNNKYNSSNVIQQVQYEPRRFEIVPIPSPDHPYPGNNIYGWMTTAECRWLYDRAKEMEDILEVGIFLGRSTHAIASAPPGKVFMHCVDPWLSMKGVYGFEDDSDEKADQRCADFLAMIGSIPGASQRLSVYRETSVEASKRFPDKSLDMPFIDGSHKYADVVQDIAHWLPKAKKIIAGHDYDPQGWPEVVSAVKLFFPEDKIKVVDTIWYVELNN